VHYVVAHALLSFDPNAALADVTKIVPLRARILLVWPLPLLGFPYVVLVALLRRAAAQCVEGPFIRLGIDLASGEALP
jgi:hypothetical protein